MMWEEHLGTRIIDVEEHLESKCQEGLRTMMWEEHSGTKIQKILVFEED